MQPARLPCPPPSPGLLQRVTRNKKAGPGEKPRCRGGHARLGPERKQQGSGDSSPLPVSQMHEEQTLREPWLNRGYTAHPEKETAPTPGFLPGESQGRRSLVGCRLWGRTESDTTDATQQQPQHAAHPPAHRGLGVCRGESTYADTEPAAPGAASRASQWVINEPKMQTIFKMCMANST